MPLLDALTIRNHLAEIVASDCSRPFSIINHYLNADARRSNWKSWLQLELARKVLGVNTWYPGAPVWYKLARGKPYLGSSINSEKCDLVFEQYNGKEPAGAEVWVELNVQKNGSVQEAKGSVADFESNVNKLKNTTDEFQTGKVLMALAVIKLDQNSIDEIRALIFEHSVQDEYNADTLLFFVQNVVNQWMNVTDSILLNKSGIFKNKPTICCYLITRK